MAVCYFGAKAPLRASSSISEAIREQMVSLIIPTCRNALQPSELLRHGQKREHEKVFPPLVWCPINKLAHMQVIPSRPSSREAVFLRPSGQSSGQAPDHAWHSFAT
jgi:hypothetical protein